MIITGHPLGPAELVWAAAGLTLAAALLGLFVDGIYTGVRSTAEMLRGYDVVMAVVVVPALVLAFRWGRCGCRPELRTPLLAVWGNVKATELANLCPDTIDEAHTAAQTGLERVGSSYQLCFNFLDHTGLSL